MLIPLPLQLECTGLVFSAWEDYARAPVWHLLRKQPAKVPVSHRSGGNQLLASTLCTCWLGQTETPRSQLLTVGCWALPGFLPLPPLQVALAAMSEGERTSHTQHFAFRVTQQEIKPQSWVGIRGVSLLPLHWIGKISRKGDAEFSHHLLSSTKDTYFLILPQVSQGDSWPGKIGWKPGANEGSSLFKDLHFPGQQKQYLSVNTHSLFP